MTDDQINESMAKAPAAYSSIIGGSQPDHEHEWECQCARCGSSLERERCEQCDDGYDGHDCGEDCCCCLHPEPNIPCDICGGDGGWWQCLSSAEWCESHPLPGRENVKRAMSEWYRVD